MLHEAVPSAAVMGLLVNASFPNAEPNTKEAQDAARKLGLELHVVSATNAQEIDAAFATLVQRRVQALVIIGNPVFTTRIQQLAILTVRHVQQTVKVELIINLIVAKALGLSLPIALLGRADEVIE